MAEVGMGCVKGKGGWGDSLGTSRARETVCIGFQRQQEPQSVWIHLPVGTGILPFLVRRPGGRHCPQPSITGAGTDPTLAPQGDPDASGTRGTSGLQNVSLATAPPPFQGIEVLIHL